MVFKKKPGDKAVEPATPATPIVDMPKTSAFSIEKDKGLWKLIISEIQDSKVISRKVIDCENRAHALERFKIKFAETYFIGR